MSTNNNPTVNRGRCLCEGVQFEIRGPLRPVTYCHCTMCRRATGHFVAATECEQKDLHFTESQSLRWYQSSAAARRGFCGTCGSQLFWEGKGRTSISILAGALDLPTGVRAEQHIFTADKGDYYEICDGLPQASAWHE
jgi:hypothetical protein